MYQIPPRQGEFIFSGDLYDALVPQDHYLRKVHQAVTFTFANDICEDLYCPDNGRPTTNYPERMLRAEFVQYHYDLSDREMEEAARLNLAIRWFLGYGNQEPFEFSALSEFRQRLGPDRHKQLFDKVLDQLKAAGLVTAREPANVDATHMEGKIARLSTPALVHRAAMEVVRTVRKVSPAGAEAVEQAAGLQPDDRREPRPREDQDVDGRQADLTRAVSAARRCIGATRAWLEKDGSVLPAEVRARVEGAVDLVDRILEENVEPAGPTPTEGPSETTAVPAVREREEKPGNRVLSVNDPDARTGHKTKQKSFRGYKHHTSVTDRGVITRVEVTAGNKDDGQQLPGMVEGLEKDHGITPEKMRGDTAYGIGANFRRLREGGIELAAPPRCGGGTRAGLPKEQFPVDEARGVAVCPAGKESVTKERRPSQEGTVYFFSAADCGSCPMKAACTKGERRSIFVSEYEPEFAAARARGETEEGREDRKVRMGSERVYGEMKERHGLGRARYWGLAKARIQAYLTAMVVDIKRLVGTMEVTVKT